MVRVRIPTILRPYVNGAASVEVEAATVGEVLEQLTQQHAELGPRLLDEAGELQRYCNLFLGDEDVRYLEGLSTRVPPDGELTIVPAVSGGAGPVRPVAT